MAVTERSWSKYLKETVRSVYRRGEEDVQTFCTNLRRMSGGAGEVQVAAVRTRCGGGLGERAVATP